MGFDLHFGKVTEHQSRDNIRTAKPNRTIREVSEVTGQKGLERKEAGSQKAGAESHQVHKGQQVLRDGRTGCGEEPGTEMWQGMCAEGQEDWHSENKGICSGLQVNRAVVKPAEDATLDRRRNKTLVESSEPRMTPACQGKTTLSHMPQSSKNEAQRLQVEGGKRENINTPPVPKERSSEIPSPNVLQAEL
ncbi:hypothetical protein P7K49_031326, partial [Saguinus oedipus]